MSKKKLSPFSVVKISFLLFLAYVCSVYMQRAAGAVLCWECGLQRTPEQGGGRGRVQFRKETKAGMAASLG
jgi:hypothetical protein